VSDTKSWECNGTLQQLITDLQEACNIVREEVLYNILFEFSIQMKLVRLIKMCLSKNYGNVCRGKHLFHAFYIKNDLK
jgi:hypothetical protein